MVRFGNKFVSQFDIPCGGSTQVTVQLIGQTGIAGNPTDIMLVLDRSGSMAGLPLEKVKEGAKLFVDIIDKGSDGLQDGIISNGSRIGVISFETNAVVNLPLSTNAALIKTTIDSLVSGDLTNHEAAFQLAQSQLSATNPSNNKVIIIMTDGMKTAGGDPDDDAAAAKASGTEIFCIGLGNNIQVDKLKEWSTDPDSEHTFIAPTPADLIEIFETIGIAFTIPAGTNITVTEIVNNKFTVSNPVVSKGNVQQLGNQLTWTINTLETEVANLTFIATHKNTTCVKEAEYINHMISFQDDEGLNVTFPNPAVTIRGCAASIELNPPADENIVGTNHTVTATVKDRFGSPVSGINVDFEVTGTNSIVDGDPSNPTPAFDSGVTNGFGQVAFTYTNSQASVDTITAIVPLQPNACTELSISSTKKWNPISAAIDIKPGSFPNSFGAKSRGNIPVALFGSPVFDVTKVDDSKVLFGDAPSPYGDAAKVHKVSHIGDANGDGIPDKVYHFRFTETGLDPSDKYGCLGGEINGLDFLGFDSVNIVPGSKE